LTIITALAIAGGTACVVPAASSPNASLARASRGSSDVGISVRPRGVTRGRTVAPRPVAGAAIALTVVVLAVVAWGSVDALAVVAVLAICALAVVCARGPVVVLFGVVALALLHISSLLP